VLNKVHMRYISYANIIATHEYHYNIYIYEHKLCIYSRTQQAFVFLAARHRRTLDCQRFCNFHFCHKNALQCEAEEGV
jgi:hypothetical protein